MYGHKGSSDQHAVVQQLREGPDDFVAIFVQRLGDGIGSNAHVAPGVDAGDTLQGNLLGTRRALGAAGRRSLVITVGTADEATVGALIALFERAVELYASLVEVNAYDQPGVEAGKSAALDLLELSRRARAVLEAGPQPFESLAERLGDAGDLLYVLERLVHTGRATRTGPVAGTYGPADG